MIKEKVTITRRDVRKLISAAIDEGASGDWESIEAQFIAIVAKLRTAKEASDFTGCLDELVLLHEGIVNLLEVQIISEKTAINGDEIRQHIQNSNTESINEFDPSSGEEQGDNLAEKPIAPRVAREKTSPGIERTKSFPLGMVLRACPQIIDYAPAGGISHWRDLMTAAAVVRSTLGVSPSAYEEACGIMGPENAAIAVACILERFNLINSPGGYLRDLTKRSERGEFSLGPMLMALLKANSGNARLVG